MNNIVYCYPEGKTKALTMSFDDGKVYDRRLVEIFNRYGIKGTFHLNTASLDCEGTVTSAEIPELYKGHEVSLHTHTHPALANMPSQQIYYEIRENKRILEEICSHEIVGMSYPIGSFNEAVFKVMEDIGVLYGRTTLSTGNFEIPENFLKWNPTIHYARGTQGWSPNAKYDGQVLLEKAEEFTRYSDALRKMPIMQVWGHSYELEYENHWDIMEEFCRYITKFENIWFAQNIEVTDYITALRKLRFSENCDIVYNPTALDLWISVNGVTKKLSAGQRTSI